MLEGVSRKELAARARRMSTAYREGASSAAAVATRTDVLAYLVARMPATYAAVAAALGAARTALPGFAPASVLDVGAGPGTATFAATEVWPEIGSATLIDASRQLLAAAGELAAAAGHPALADAQRILADAARFGRDLPRADLVIASYFLAEAANPGDAVAALWRASSGTLALIEPGTPAGFARIRAARSALIGAGAMIAAPCPHDLPCPIVEPDWCHFGVRLARTRDHRIAKGGEAPFEDEKFSYVVAVRPPLSPAMRVARVLARPNAGKSTIVLKLCQPDGTIAERSIARRDRQDYAAARRVRWGDRFG